MQYPISSLCWQNLPSYFHSTDHCRKRVWFQYIIYPWNETLSFWGSSSNTKSSHNFTILNVGRSITARNNRRHCMWSIITSYFKMITVKQKADNPPKSVYYQNLFVIWSVQWKIVLLCCIFLNFAQSLKFHKSFSPIICHKRNNSLIFSNSGIWLHPSKVDRDVFYLDRVWEQYHWLKVTHLHCTHAH